ncbi:DUF1499 domain-containing protein [Roseomonas alkaliterrae]|uniref:Uncharacterized protein (DUF1499 family) n=1 Tax=Neoroseomonas alkaliterrae TaxID=1452450 RepID=A0A840XTE4_9PROT|nr:DUF1499 domain-containing protein [Neoroseomonas alkaliterrae]MBB5691176.1 uncharacterized protein (DUF1499 family) [Neoroseomonas alkaliterrae]MBR0676276.1 DUF1499 domain-containing protein [Neoroseomonas alkaliterrae]
MIRLLLSRGAQGVPAPEPVDFATLVLPTSPNTCLLTPATAPGAGHLHRDPFPVSPEEALAAIRAVAASMPRTFPLAEFPARRQVQWVARTRLMNYPDIVVAEVAPAGAGTGLWLYSRSLIGWSDLGANRARVTAWLAAFEERIRRR